MQDSYVGKPQKTKESPERLYKGPTNFTKPQKTIQSPERQYKDIKYYTKPQLIGQRQKYEARVATNTNFTYDMKYLNKTTYINKKCMNITKNVLNKAR